MFPPLDRERERERERERARGWDGLDSENTMSIYSELNREKRLDVVFFLVRIVFDMTQIPSYVLSGKINKNEN